MRLLSLLLAALLLACSSPERLASTPQADTADTYTTHVLHTNVDGGTDPVAGDNSAVLVGNNPSSSNPGACLTVVAGGLGVCFRNGGWSTCPNVSPGTKSTPHANATDWTAWTTAGTGNFVTGLLNRSISGPFASCDIFVIPMPTNDMGIGAGTATYGTSTWHHDGAALLAAGLAMAASYYPTPTTVHAYGISAGCMAFALIANAVVGTWPGATVDLICDSGPLLPPPYWPLQSQADAVAAWSAALPAGCINCTPNVNDSTSGLSNAWPYATATYARVLYVESYRDTVTSTVLSDDTGSGDASLPCSPGNICGPNYNAACTCDFGTHAITGQALPGLQTMTAAIRGAGGYTMTFDDASTYAHPAGVGAKAAQGPLSDEGIDGGAACTVPVFVTEGLAGSWSLCSGNVQ